MKSMVLQITALILSLAAMTVSYKLLQKHLVGNTGSTWFESGCSAEDNEDGGANCAAVLASPWSYWPPKHEGDNKPGGHLPVAFVGVVYYSVLAVWLVGVGCPGLGRRYVHLFPLGLASMGLSGSAYFTYIMFTKLDYWCPWCLVTHGLNLLIMVCLLVMWPRDRGSGEAVAVGPESTGGTNPPQGERSTAPLVAARIPTYRQLMATGLAMIFVVFGGLQFLSRTNNRTTAEAYKKAFVSCQAHLKKSIREGGPIAAWEQSPEHNITVHNDDPIRTKALSGDATMQVVVFTDFECPVCARLARFLEHKVQPLFAGQLSIVFKHYPLDIACNPHLTKPFHAHACDGARFAEAAHLLGGNEAFWGMHDFLFANQAHLKTGQITKRQLGAAAGLNIGELDTEARSEEVAARIQRDIDQATRLGVHSTPSLFLRGRLVDPVLRNEILFWDRMAEQFWQSQNKPRPASTKLPSAPRGATQDTRDQRDAG